MADADREAFVRQRRNLFGASLVLIFLNTAGVELKQLNIFGNDIALKNPHVISYLFAVAVLYFLWRFFQHSFWQRNTGVWTALFACVDKQIGVFLFRHELRDPESEISKMVSQGYLENGVEFDFLYYRDDYYLDGVSQCLLREGRNTGAGPLINVPLWAIARAWVRGGFDFAYKNKPFSEYVLPVILGFSALLSFLPCFSNLLTN